MDSPAVDETVDITDVVCPMTFVKFPSFRA
jgi:hypothetical protein